MDHRGVEKRIKFPWDSTEEVSRGFCARFALPDGFFSAPDEADFTKILEGARIHPDRSARPAHVPRQTPAEWLDQSAQLTRHERKALGVLSARLLSAKRPVFAWVASVASGASWIATQLMSQAGISLSYDHIFRVWLERSSEIHEAQLHAV